MLPCELSTSIHHSHSHYRSPTSLLFSRPPQRAGFLYRSPGRARARPTRWNSWTQSAPPPAPAGSMTSWRHQLHRCTRRHIQSCPSRGAHARPERASPRAELERFQHWTSLSRRPRSFSTHAELAQLQHWPRSPPTEVTESATRTPLNWTYPWHQLS